MKYLAALFLVVIIAGCASGLPSPNGVRVTGQELKELITGATVRGRSYKRKQGFVERYHPDGRYEVAYTRARYSEDYGKTHKGTWRIDGDEVCYKVASLNSDGCVIIYRQYTQIEFVLPETGKSAFFSYEIEYEGKNPPSNAATPPPPAPPLTAAVPSPPTSPPAPVAPAPSTPLPVAPQPAPQPPRNLKPVASGSGFIVSNQTYVLTNAHVIKGCVEVTVKIDDRDIRATVRARDRRNDLALLRLPAGKHPVAVFQGDNRIFPGDTVVAIGYPLSDILAAEGNVSVGTVSALAGLGNNASLLQISNPVQPGNSGGPLFDTSGHVVGVIVSRLDFAFTLEAYGTLPQNVNFAVKSTVAMLFMQASGVEYKARNSAKELRPADVARKGRPATVPIQCWE